MQGPDATPPTGSTVRTVQLASLMIMYATFAESKSCRLVTRCKYVVTKSFPDPTLQHNLLAQLFDDEGLLCSALVTSCAIHTPVVTRHPRAYRSI